MNIVLQLWGGLFFLANKIFFSLSERSEEKRFWKIRSWIVYLVGLPAWVTIFVLEHNWIAASIETAGALAMILGLVNALRGEEGDAPKWLDWLVRVAIVLGISVSLYDFGGLNKFTQWLELSMVTGYLIGTYTLAKRNPAGYKWFMLMNASNAILMGVQDYTWLMIQQLVSLGFVVDAYWNSRKGE